MSENKPGTALTAEELKAVSGGDCTVEDFMRAVENFKQTYEALIDFTSYMIERVAGETPPAP